MKDPLKISCKISCKIAPAVLLVAAVFLMGCGIASRGGGTPLNPTKPTVVYESPSDGGMNVERSSRVVLTFSVQMDPATLNTSNISLMQGAPTAGGGGITVEGTISTDDFNAVFAASDILTGETTFYVKVTTGVKSIFGVAMAATFTSTFETGTEVDVTTPEVESTVPGSDETEVARDAVIRATFDEDMDPTTANSGTFILTGPGAVSVEGVISCVGPLILLSPSLPLSPNTTYEARLTTGLKCTGGAGLASDYRWTFMTRVSGDTQGPVDLTTAESFGVFASDRINNTNDTTVNGDIGVSPGTTVSVPPTSYFTMYLGSNPTAKAADLAVDAAYADADNRTIGAVELFGGGEIGGLTFTPGLYTTSETLSVSSGNVTLNAQGNPNAVFIFQVNTNLTVAANRTIILANSAQAKNVFWQVGNTVSIGNNAVFKGTILSNYGITLGSGVHLTGRALSKSSSVTLHADLIDLP